MIVINKIINKYLFKLNSEIFSWNSKGKTPVVVIKEIIKHNTHCLILNLNQDKWISVIKNINKNLKRINTIKKNAFELSKKYTYKNRAKQILEGLI